MKRLNNAQSFKLANYVLSQREFIESKRPTRGQLATLASESLGFAVTSYSIKTALDTAGIPWHQRRGNGFTKNGEAIALLASAIVYLADNLGIGIDPKVKSLAEVS